MNLRVNGSVTAAGGAGRLSDAIHGNPLMLGGLGGVNSWAPAVRQQPSMFSVYVDAENQPPPAAGAALPDAAACGGVSARVTLSKLGVRRVPLSTVSCGQENLSVAASTRLPGKSPVSQRPTRHSRPPAVVAAASVNAGGCENNVFAGAKKTKTAAARTVLGQLPAAAPHHQPDQPQPHRKQKLRQRPLHELQSGKRVSLHRAPVSAAAAAGTSVNQQLLLLPSSNKQQQQQLESGTPAASVTSSLHSSFESALLLASGGGGGSGVAAPAACGGAWPTDAAAAAAKSACAAGDVDVQCVALSKRAARTTGGASIDDVFAFEEYAADVYSVMCQSEVRHRARVGFMARQPDITLAMRAILVDWLVEVNDEYKMSSETLHLAVNYIDRFLSVMSVVRGKLQLVGTTALFIAAKFEEIYPPTAVEFVYITDDTYTVSQLKRMEHVMLKMLAFDVATPTCCWFLNYYCCRAAPLADSVKHLAQYLVELCLVQYEIHNRYLCSHQAAAALSLAVQMNEQAAWPHALATATGYTMDEIRACAEEMLVVWQIARCQPQQSLVDKFGQDKYSRVSTVQPPSHCRWL